MVIYSEPKGSVYTGRLETFENIGAAVVYNRGFYGVTPDVRTLPKVGGVDFYYTGGETFLPFSATETVTHYGSNIDVGDGLDDVGTYDDVFGPLCVRPWMFSRGYAGDVRIRFMPSDDCFFKNNLTSSLTYGLYMMPILAQKNYLFVPKLTNSYSVKADVSNSTNGRHIQQFDMILNNVPADTPIVGFMPYYNTNASQSFIGGGTNPRHYYAQASGISSVTIEGQPVLKMSQRNDPWASFTNILPYGVLSLFVFKSDNFIGLQEQSQSIECKVWTLPRGDFMGYIRNYQRYGNESHASGSLSIRPSLSPSFSLPGITTPNLGVRPETLILIGGGILLLAYLSNRNRGLSDLGQSTTGAVTNVADAVGNTAGLVANVSDKANRGIDALFDVGYGIGRMSANGWSSVSKTVTGGTKSGSAVIKTTSGGLPASLSTSVSAPIAASGLLVSQVRQSVASATASKPSVIDAAKNVLAKASPALSAVNSLSKIRIK